MKRSYLKGTRKLNLRNQTLLRKIKSEKTKHNEISHVMQDYGHPKMFYLTGNRPEIRNYQAKEKPVAPADVRKRSEKKVLARSKRQSLSASQGTFPKAPNALDSDRISIDRKTIQTAITRRLAKAKENMPGY